MPFPPKSTASRLKLDNVTLCAVSSSNVPATIRAIEVSIHQIQFAKAILFTHGEPSRWRGTLSDEIQIVPIELIESSAAYSKFVLEDLVDHITTSHCLVIQWDGHVLDASKWRSEFLNFDYIGASWPQFDDNHRVGNGGFSLRSRRLLAACREAEFYAHHPEDLAIGRTNRAMLEAKGLRFAPVHLADLFSAERSSDPALTFGYHGVFLMLEVMGLEAFWNIYQTLDDRSTLRRDLASVRRSLFRRQNGFAKALKLTLDQWQIGTKRR